MKSQILGRVRLVFYVPGSTGILDEVILIDGCQRGAWTGKDLMLTRATYPTAILVPYNEALRKIADAAIRPPVEVDADRFSYMRTMLPPVGWVLRQDAETFRVMGDHAADVSTIMARINGRYFEMRDKDTLSHDKIIAKVRGAFRDI